MEDKKKDRTLLHRYVDNLYTTEEARRLLEECRTGSSDELFNDMSAEIWEESSFHQFETDVEREKYKDEARQLLHRINGNKSKKYYRLWHAVAGVAAVLCLVWGGIYYFRYVADGQITYLTASTSFGEHKKVCLPDGTCLVLNACSQIRYPNRFVGKERRVSLEGEAYFDVTRDERRPFVVHTPEGTVSVLGTEFDVNAYDGGAGVVTTLVEGSVRVAKAGRQVVLRPGEQLSTAGRDAWRARRVDVLEYVGWKNGVYFFSRRTLEELMEIVERNYDVTVFFANEDCKSLRFSGDLKKYDELGDFLRFIETGGDVRFVVADKTVTVYRK